MQHASSTAGVRIRLSGAELIARGSGALYWPEHALLCVSDLHLGKAQRPARLGGATLPPYETKETLHRLAAEIDATGARIIVCLGDSFDTLEAAEALQDEDRLWISRLQAGRRWIWIEGNHDPGPIELGGTHLAAFECAPLTFRHIADAQERGEVSGHYHPKVRLQTRARTLTRPAFLFDAARLVLPAFGAYTGGLYSDARALLDLMAPDAQAVLTGPVPRQVPMPR